MSISDIKNDLSETISEILYLLSDADRKLAAFLDAVNQARKHIQPASLSETVQTGKTYRDELASHGAIIRECYAKVRTLASQEDIHKIDTIIENTREYLRTHIGLFGALITSTDWQSPTFAHAQFSLAGRQTGKIYATINDYKRDQHWDAYAYEQKFLNEHIDALIKFPIHVFTTSSGMAAFTTILLFLIGEKKLPGSIVAGNSIYFENKGLLTQMFADKVIYADEQDLDSFISVIHTHDPSAIFIDSLTNAPRIISPDIPKLIRWLISHVKQETYLVIDNTGLSVQLQPYKQILGRRTKLRIITFESLNKYHQFGMDRVTAGIITSYSRETGKLFDYRDHGGTNIIDSTAVTLPTPNRKWIETRLRRHARNARMLTLALRQWIGDHPNHPVRDISYPSRGSYLSLIFQPKKQTISTYKRFVSAALSVAKKKGVNLTSGTSFGLNATRIYLTAVRSRPNTPFVRIAVGTEHTLNMERVIDVFIETLKKFT